MVVVWGRESILGPRLEYPSKFRWAFGGTDAERSKTHLSKSFILLHLEFAGSMQTLRDALRIQQSEYCVGPD